MKKLIYSVEINIENTSDEKNFKIGRFFELFKEYIDKQLGSTS